MKKLISAALIWLGLMSAAYAGCTNTTLSQCPSPIYNAVTANSYTDGSGNPLAGVWSGTGFGYTSPPTVAQMAASLSASPQPLIVTTLTPTGGIVGNTSGTAAAAGKVGEVLSSNATTVVAAATISPLASVTLTAGSWMCSGSVAYTTVSSGANNLQSFLYLSSTIITSTENIATTTSNLTSGYELPTGLYFTSIASSESLYVGAYSNVSASSVTAYISCLRVR